MFPVSVAVQTTKNDITISHNVISESEIGVLLDDATNCCTINHNVVKGSPDYGLAAIDREYSFSNDKIIGGEYGIDTIATVTDTTAILNNVLILQTSIALTTTHAVTGLTATVVINKM